MSKPRRGWREKIEPGLYRAHRVACRSTEDRRPGRRCGCAYELTVPGCRQGATRPVTFYGSLREARNHRRELMAAGRPEPPPEPAGGTMHDLAVSYFTVYSKILAPSTIKARSDAWRLRLHPKIGHIPPDELDREDVAVLFSELLDECSWHQVWKARGALRAILKAAVEWKRVAENVAAGHRLPRPMVDAEPAERVLDYDQLQALFAACTTLRVETMARSAGEAGLRNGEMIGLRWGDVDLPARRLTIQRAVWQKPGKRVGESDDGKPVYGPPERIVGPPKGGRARKVAISAHFAKRLAEWFELSVVGAGAAADGYVWAGRDGGPMDDGTPRQAIERALIRAGLVSNPDRKKGERAIPLITLHGLRHTCGSILLERGVELPTVSRHLGHASPDITARIYSHVVNGQRLDVAAAVFDVPEAAPTLGETLGDRAQAAEIVMNTGV